MTTKQKIGCWFGSARMLITQPIWYYLLYQILVYVHATDLQWFLFWVYFPLGIVLVFLETLLQNFAEEK